MSVDWLKKWYKDSLANSSAGSPEIDNWTKIEAKMNDVSAYWYTSNMEENDSSPSKDVWSKLNVHLEQINKVKRARRLTFFRALSIVTVLLFFPFILADLVLISPSITRQLHLK